MSMANVIKCRVMNHQVIKHQVIKQQAPARFLKDQNRSRGQLRSSAAKKVNKPDSAASLRLALSTVGGRIGISVLVVAMSLLAPSFATAQYTRIGTPFQNNSDAFYERIGIDFGFALPQMGNPNGSRIVGLNPDGSFTRDGSIRFTQGNAGSAVPPFGGYDPNADATFGFARVNPNGSGFQLGFRAGHGSSRTSTMAAPSIVVPNGVQGSFSDSQMRPFVTNVIPVVGGLPPGFFQAMYSPGPAISPLDVSLSRLREEMAAGRIYRDDNGRFVTRGQQPREETTSQAAPAPLESTATQGDLSVAEIRRRRAAAEEAQVQANQAEIEKNIQSAEASAEKRNYGAASYFYRTAARLATGELKKELEAKQAEMKLLSKQQ